ncbi:MAG: carboxypeptidase regulatory-like domain-containing protein, partial [Thiomargarita sp.]|nr:carboxypeptidase regulatory-like domain-containing protein [Thiomargarita sp.]
LNLNIAGNILNNGTWNNYRTTLTFPSGDFRMTGTPTYEEPKRLSSYDITDYLTTQHHWQVNVEGAWTAQKGINDPNLIAMPTVNTEVVVVPEVEIVQDSNATISGFVRTPEGKGVKGIKVCFYNLEEGQECNQATTDVDGSFSLDSLIEGVYIIIPHSPEGKLNFNPGSEEILLSDSDVNLDFIASPVVVNPDIFISVNELHFNKENNRISVNLKTDVEGADITEKDYDIYIAVGTGDTILFQNSTGAFTNQLLPYLKNVYIKNQSAWRKLFDYVFPDDLPFGEYFIHAAVLDKEKGEVVAEANKPVIYDPEGGNFTNNESENIPPQPDEPNNSGIGELRSVAEEMVRQVAKIIDNDALNIAVSSSDAFNLLNEIPKAMGYYESLGRDVALGYINEDQRDLLFVTKVLTILFEIAQVPTASKYLTDQVRGAIIDINQGKMKLANQNILSGLNFDVTFKFNHGEGWWRYEEPRCLKVSLDALVMYKEGSVKPENKLVRTSESPKKQPYYYGFDINSKKNRGAFSTSKLLAISHPGFYVLTALDQESNAVRRKTLYLNGASPVTIKFDYRKDTYKTAYDWKKQHGYNPYQDLECNP